jgi:iron-sulfur cluster assembly accessory protein
LRAEDKYMQQVEQQENIQPMFNKVITDQITLSPTAHQQIKRLMDEEDGIKGVRIFVQGGGCSGMTYSMTFATERFEHDCVFERDGLGLYVDAVAMNFLEGVEIDYVENPTGASFTFKNVFQAVGGGGTCAGCGAAGSSAY